MKRGQNYLSAQRAEGNTGTVDFYDQNTGQFLGQADLNPTGDPSGSATASLNVYAEETDNYNLGIGSYSIIAVYSGDDNFSGSQSSGTSVNVVGDTLSFGNSLSVSGPGCDSGISYEGDAATLSGTVTGLDGAAFSVSVNWGDGTQSDNDNGGQPFYFPVGWNSRTFGVSHYYSDYGSYTVSVTVTASDGRQTGNSGNSVDLTVSPVAPEVIVDSSPLPDDGAYDPNTQYTLMAYGFSPDQGSVSYQWTADGNNLPATNVQTTLSDGTVVTGSSVQVMGSQCDDVTVAVSSGSAYRDVNFGDTRDALGWAEQELPLPTVSISETDTNQTVSAGSQAHFEIQLSRAVTYAVTVCYNTVDGTNGPPIDYDSTYGPQEVTIAAGQTAVTLPTNAGQPDGALDPVTVSLVDPFLCQVDSSGGGGGGATANVQDPQLQIYLTGVENDEMILISSGGPVNVKVGETVTLYAFTSDGLDAAPTWTLPGNGEVIESYNPNLPTDQLTLLGQSGGCGDNSSRVVTDAHTFDFEFVAGGSFNVTATVGSGSVTASFRVQAPNVTVNATVKQPALKAGQTLLEQTIVTPSFPGVFDQLQMQPFLWTVANLQAPQGNWQYCFLQTATISRMWTVPAANPVAAGNPGKVAGAYVVKGPTSGLDKGLPYNNKGPYTSMAAINAAGIGDGPSTAVFGDGGFSYYEITAATYFMCQALSPTGCPIGGWVPLAELTWVYDVTANWDWYDTPSVTSNIIVSGEPTATGTPYPFGAPQGLPQWGSNVTPGGPGTMINKATGNTM
jgi:hypothetical protein